MTQTRVQLRPMAPARHPQRKRPSRRSRRRRPPRARRLRAKLRRLSRRPPRPPRFRRQRTSRRVAQRQSRMRTDPAKKKINPAIRGVLFFRLAGVPLKEAPPGAPATAGVDTLISEEPKRVETDSSRSIDPTTREQVSNYLRRRLQPWRRDQIFEPSAETDGGVDTLNLKTSPATV